MRSPSRLLHLAALGVVAMLAVSGCGGSDEPTSKQSASTSPSATTSASSSGDPALAQKVTAIGDQLTAAGTGAFTTTDSSVSGQQVSKVVGTYDLKAETYQATATVADGQGGQATAKIRVVGGAAYLQVDRWKKAVRSCWLKTTPDDLANGYALDLGTGTTPLPLQILGDFTAVSAANGDEVIQGEVPLTTGILVLGGDLKRKLISAKPAGNVAAFVTSDQGKVTLTLPGYTLADSLSKSLKVDDTQFAAMKNERYESTITSGKAAPATTAPAADVTMTAEDLQDNRCG